jgi:thiopeptide-type bacteriocin biosynthesis protein
LALDKQPPPLARFLANLTRAFLPSWTAFDWGPAAHNLPYLPQVRYGRTILTPARWQLRADELPTGGPGPRWRTQLTAWRARWRCPPVVDLRDDDRSLRLELDHPLHAAILHAHLARHPQAVLTTATKPDDVAWAGGHVHEIAVPLASTHPAVPCPPLSAAPTLGNTHGDLPAAPAGRWLQARLLAHPDSHDQILTEHLPRLVGLLDDPDWWFIRYRDPHQSDHLRLRIRQPADPLLRAEYAAAVSVWADQLRHASLSSGLILDSYIPEVGRYGTGAALDAAESVFVADSRLALAALRHRSRTDRLAWATMNLADLAVGMHDAHAAEWLARRKPAGHASPAPDRAVADEAIRGATAALSDTLDLDAFAAPVAAAWKARRAALAAYRATLTQPLRDRAGWALLHMHHNRSLGIDPEQEAVCLRLTRQAALGTLHSPAPAPGLGSKP